MPTFIPAPSSNFPVLPELTPIHVRILEINKRKDEKFPNADGTPKDRLEFVFGAIEPEEYAGGRAWAFAGLSWHEKGWLRKIVQACYPTELSEDELYAVDVDSLVGKDLVIAGEHREGSDYLKITTYRRVKPGKNVAAPAPAAAPAVEAPAAAPETSAEDTLDF